MNQETYTQRYNDLKTRSKKVLYAQYKCIMDEHDYCIKAYESISKDLLIWNILYIPNSNHK